MIPDGSGGGGTDWSPLGGNPVPGDPAGIRAAATVLDGIASQVGQQQRLVNSVSTGGLSGWQGPSASSFRSTVSALNPALSTMVSSQTSAADAMRTFANQLETFQVTAGQLLTRAQTAQADAMVAQSLMGPLNAQVTAAQTAYNTAVGNTCPAPRPPGFIGPVVVPGAQQLTDLQTAQANLNAQVTAWKTAQSTLTSLQSQASALNGQAAAAAAACASAVNAASDPAGSTGADNVVVSFLGSAGFTTASGLLAIPDATVKKLEDEAEEADQALAKAEAAEQTALDAISQAGRDLRSGDTAAARSEASQILRNSQQAKADLADALSKAEDGQTSAAAAVTDFGEAWSSSVAGKGVLGASRILGYSWNQAYALGQQVLGNTDSAAAPVAADAVPGLSDALGDSVPVVGTVLAGGLTAYDLSHGNYVQAGGDAGGYVASVATGTAIVLLASNPAGWVVIGVSVGVGVAVTEGIDHYKTVLHFGESILDAPGNFVNSLAHDLNPASFLGG